MNSITKVFKVAARKARGSLLRIDATSCTFRNCDDEVTIACDNEGVLVTECHSIEEFELVDNLIGHPMPIENVEGTEFNAREFRSKLEYCMLAMDFESTRYHLATVNWEDDKLVATDGRRMHVQHIGLAEDRKTMERRQRPIRAKTCDIVLECVKQFKDDIIRVYFVGEEVFFSGLFWCVRSSLLAGNFPACWRDVIPTDDDLVETETVAVKQLREYCKDAIRRSTLENKVESSKLTRSEKRRFQRIIPTVIVGGVKLNAEYVEDAVSNVYEVRIVPRVAKNGKSPCRIGDCVMMPLAK